MRLIFSINTKKFGTTNKVKSVELTTPPMVAIPSGMRAAPPAPQPVATGSIPTIIATKVIRIGLSRMGAELTIASAACSPERIFLHGKIDEKNTVICADSGKQNNPSATVQTERVFMSF